MRKIAKRNSKLVIAVDWQRRGAQWADAALRERLSDEPLTQHDAQYISKCDGEAAKCYKSARKMMKIEK